MPDNYARRRFELPADWTPSELWCVTIWVPGDQDYVEQLSGLLKELGDSKHYQRDDTKTGAAIVARTWRAALNLEPPRIGDCAQPVPSPVLGTEAERADYAVAIIRFFRTALLAPFVTCAGLSQSCDDCVDSVMDDLAPYGSGATLRAALVGLCTAVKDATPTEIDEAETDCFWADEFSDLADKVGNPYDWLNNLSDWLFEWLNETSDDLFNALNNAAGVIGGNGIQGWIDDNGGVDPGSGAGFGGDCTWSHTFNGTLGWGDWHIHEFDPQYGHASGGDWVNDTDGAEWSLILDLDSLTSDYTLTHIGLTYDTPDGVPPFGQHRVRSAVIGGGFGDLAVIPLGSHTNPVEWDGSQSVGNLQFDVEQPSGYSCTLSEIVLEGVGIDPYA